MPTVERGINSHKMYADGFGNRSKCGIVIDKWDLRETLGDESSPWNYRSTSGK
jgi:hypothetical protein